MSNPTAPGTNKDILQERITAMLESDGSLTEEDRRKLNQYLLQDIRADVKSMLPLATRVKKLEDASIVIQAAKHPKITSTVVGSLILVVMFLQEVGNWISSHISLISNLKLP